MARTLLKIDVVQLVAFQYSNTDNIQESIDQSELFDSAILYSKNRVKNFQISGTRYYFTIDSSIFQSWDTSAWRFLEYE